MHAHELAPRLLVSTKNALEQRRLVAAPLLLASEHYCTTRRERASAMMTIAIAAPSSEARMNPPTLSFVGCSFRSASSRRSFAARIQFGFPRPITPPSSFDAASLSPHTQRAPSATAR